MQFTLRPPHYNVTNYLLDIKKICMNEKITEKIT